VRAPAEEQRFSGPRVRDWVLLGIGVAFVICGAILLPSKPEGAVPVLVVRPPHARRRVMSSLRSNMQWVGAHVTIMSSQYAIDLPLLIAVIERYVAEPLARDGLAVPSISRSASPT
jgi:hypothetical protein